MMRMLDKERPNGLLEICKARAMYQVLWLRFKATSPCPDKINTCQFWNLITLLTLNVDSWVNSKETLSTKANHKKSDGRQYFSN